MLSLHVCSRNVDSPKRLVLWHRRVKSLQKCVAGILMYEMLYGRTPFRGRNRQKTFTNILEKDLTFPASIPVSVEIVCCYLYFEITHYPRTMQWKPNGVTGIFTCAQNPEAFFGSCPHDLGKMCCPTPDVSLRHGIWEAHGRRRKSVVWGSKRLLRILVIWNHVTEWKWKENPKLDVCR
jgi:hypothetical protein